jgi:polysaccharide biosynthesis/export protein
VTDVRTLFLLMGIALLPGCFVAPAMQMDEAAAVQRGRERTKDENFNIQLITSELVTRIALETAPPPRMTDPLAADAASYEYRIAPYDVLMVTVWDHPELTTPTGQFRSPEENGNRVNADGTMFYPFVGVVQVGGKTAAEIRKLLTERLTRVIQNPQLDVRVAAFRGKRAQVTGEVLQPTTVPITDVPLRIQDAIALARGFTPEADWSNVTLSRGGRTYHLNLQALYENGDISQNWLITAGDVINVGDRNRNKVFVMGEVRQPQSKLMVKGRLTLAEAINETGGLEPSVANVGQIFVIRGSYDAPEIYRLDARSADALLLASQFQLRPRDVVFVSTYGLAQWNRVMLQILPTVTALWTTYDLSTRAANTVRTGTPQ